MRQAFRAEILDFVAAPSVDGKPFWRHYGDGLLLLEGGKVVGLGEASTLLPTLPPEVFVHDYRGRLILPGFIDTHIHYPQCDVIASYGEHLLSWLERYTFPVERRFADIEHGRVVARFFRQELLRNGTTTAMVFATVHPQSVDALCEEVVDMRLVVGKVMMDRNVPPDLADTAESAYRQSVELIGRWHNRGRISYALTPRFAPTSSEAQLAVVGDLIKQYPDLHLQTHLAENPQEVAWVRSLFPWSRSYLDVYDRYGMLRPGSVYAHCLHLEAEDWVRLSQTGAAIAFCPTSNLFLGSGLFDMDSVHAHQVRLGLATDVGGGTSFSLLRTLAEGYKMLQLRQQRLSPLEAFYLITLGGARALYLDRVIGNFDLGKEADFVVIDMAATPLMGRRMALAQSLEERLFVLMMLADDRAVAATYLLGEEAYRR